MLNGVVTRQHGVQNASCHGGDCERTFLFLLFIGVFSRVKNTAELGTRRRFRAFDTILHRLEDQFYSRYSIETGQSLMIPLPLLILLDAKTICIH